MTATKNRERTIDVVQEILMRAEASPVIEETIAFPDGQEWWAAPRALSRDLGAFKVGVSQRGSVERVGYRLDKGLSPEARAYNVPTRFIMYEPWPFMALSHDGEFRETFFSLVGQLPVHLWVSVTNGLVPGFTPLVGPFKHAFHWRIHEHGQLELAEPVFDMGVVGGVAQSTSVPDVLHYLETLPEWRWYWVSLFFGLEGDDITRPNLERLVTPFLRWWQ
ncbi:MAG: hypothetical protein C7B44_02080 [Sulfobacillus thermosulfidooxidans]|uniref:hypothetical protein n=1 Tax=Sulfobacillus TaxID=28033 RepID=UPI000CD2A383|nr:hypothetical protein [Sulfobacillus sp. hq2]MCY0908425.1 hypothetical protein [Sulfobacillus thermotolerans]POB09106.1 hypothetical protein CO251_16160 [Sulfobacillus sp. hq2]PSR37761.1 MAG: hypothetical protein C7B44_02080 [Sulfobacillus thermosulfidooxidans]